MHEQEGRIPPQDKKEANTRKKTRAKKPDESQQGGAEAQQIFSPAEQKRSERSNLIQAISKKIEGLIEPNEGDAEDVNLTAKRVLQGLHFLEGLRLLLS